MKRRDFLKLSGGATAGAVLAGLGFQNLLVHALPTGTEDSGTGVPGVPSWANTICQQCPGGCGVRVKLVDGRAINISGNPLYPINREGVCPKGISGLQALYDPDRIKGPLKRVGERGSGKWQQITWEEAVATVASELKALRQKGEPQSAVFVTGQVRGLMVDLFSRFALTYGTPNHIRHTSGIDGSALPSYLLQGVRQQIAYDLENASYILSFGSSFLEAGWSPVRQIRAYGILRQGKAGSRAKIVQIEPRLSMTAAKADEWVAINPGTDGALALGIARVILDERLYNESFLSQHTVGLEDWTDSSGQKHTGFKALVQQNYAVDRVAEITGVPVETIIRIAREFARNRPAIAMAEQEVAMHTAGLYARMAVHCLNALVGSIDTPGGTVLSMEVPLEPLPHVDKDAIAQRGLSFPRLDRAGSTEFPLAESAYEFLPEALATGKPYKAKALFLYYSNPLHSLADSARVRKALESVPLIVSFSPFPDDSTNIADLILPDHTYLERWQDDPMLPVTPHSVFGVRKPVVKPLFNTMHTGDFLIKLAQASGGSVAQAFPWKDFPAVIQHRVQGLFKARRGTIVQTEGEDAWAQQLAERGVWSPSYASFEEFWKQLVEKGGWWDPSYRFGEWSRVFRTPSGKFEFFSQILRERLVSLSGNQGLEALLKKARVEARGDLVFLPHFEPERFVGDEKSYPFHLNPYKLMAHGSNQPFLLEILGPQLNTRWDTWAELHPEEAKKLGVKDGDSIWLESPLGKIQTRAKLYVGTMPRVVNIPFGLGHEAGGRWAQGIGVNPNRIMSGVEFDRLAGFPALFATRIKISKA
ncbi:MAG TPA: molybdopterin-dependent oxidoreductase [bacterium]|nr:molybdopterin-dependent oxidoreductase [bacterium]